MQSGPSFFGAALAAMTFLAMTAVSAHAGSTAQSRPDQAVQLAESCPPGTHWVEGSYARGGKWRDAHCANDDGTD
jgi:hypothetical protein